MQFLLVAYDATDDKAPERRLAARGAHLTLLTQNKARGHARYAAAILDDNGKMNGSMMVLEYDSREQLDEWLAVEPYVTQEVWKSLQITECKIAAAFAAS